MSLWNDTFKIELTFRGRNKRIRTEIISHKGSLKSAIRSIFKKYGSIHVVANIYNSKGRWIKEIGF
ncbi:hypothetical protein ACE41A_08760 [Bacillus cytotoxicus]|uniref:hypothetical protein n=1 Tax=Bacillus cytotoxicus TaxID=580165 RepID=UPI0035CB12A5